MRGEHGRGRRQTATSMSISRLGSAAGPIGASAPSRRRASMRSRPLRSAARKLSSSVPRVQDAGDDDQRRRAPRPTSPDGRPDTIRGRRARCRRARQQRQIAEPPGRQADAEQERDEEDTCRTPRRGRRGDDRGDQRRPNGSSPARRSGSAAARDRTAASRASEPDMTDANSSAAAAPAPMPMRTICTIELSRSSSG